MKKLFAVIMTAVLVFNIFSIISFADNSVLTAYDFLEMTLDFASRNEPGAFGSGSITDYPLNRLLVKTITNNPLDNDYGARDKIEGFDCMHILQYNTRAETQSAYESFKNDSCVLYVEYDFWLCKENEPFGSETNSTEDVSKEHLSWNSEAVDVDKAFDYVLNSKTELHEVVVAVIDTGMYVDHDYFDRDRIKIDESYAYVEDTVVFPTYEDDNNHGTHVSGIVYDNTMNNVLISPYRVMGVVMENMTYSVMTSVLRAVINSGNVDVINMSIYFRRYADDLSDGEDEEKIMADLLQQAIDNNIVVVTIAGNKGGDCSEFWPAQFTPGITVASSTQDNKPYVKDSKHGACVDIAAPGVDINSTVPRIGYESGTEIGEPQSLECQMSGTSQAAPLVSAAAALIKSIDPDITPAEVERIIKETAYVPEDWEENCGDKNYGTGIVNFYNIAKAMLGEGESATPKITKNSDGKFEISASVDSDARFYYTLDGSEPTLENHTLYTEPIDLRNKNAKEIKAVCHENGKLTGEATVYETTIYRTVEMDYKDTYLTMPHELAYKCKWYETNNEIADVNYKGEITAKSVGEAIVIAKLENGEWINYRVIVSYSWWQEIIRFFLLGFLWY